MGMKFLLVAVLLPLLQANNVAAGDILVQTSEDSLALQQHSVSAVVDLLKAMSKTIAQEMKEDQKSYDKLVCWCSAETKEKTETVDQGTVKIAEIESSLDGLTASRAEHETHIKELQQQVDDGQKALEKAAAVRRDQKEKFDSYEGDTTTYLVSLKAAIGVLTKKTGQTALPEMSAFMQMFSRTPPTALPQLEVEAEASDSGTLSDVWEDYSRTDPSPAVHMATERRLRGNTDGWSADDEAAVNRGLGAAMSFAQGAQGARGLELYSPGSTGELVGMFQQMLSTMEEDLKDAQAKEAQAAGDFEDLRMARLEELRQASGMVDLKKRERAHASEAIALAKSEKKQLSKVVATSREAMATVSKRCEDAEHGHSDREQARRREDAVILEAIQVLSDSSSRAVSLLQLTQAQGASKALESVHGSETSVAALATTEADSFGQVRESIDGMIRELKQQQLLDSKRKDWCKQEFFEIQRDSEAASDHQTALELRTTQMADDLKTLQADLEQTVAKREELQHQLQTAGDERKEEQAAFQQTHLDQQMTLRALKQAFRKLSGIYEAPASFLQAQQPRQAAGYQKNRMGSTVLKLLQTLMADAKGLVEKATTAENQAEASYGSFVEETKTMLESLQADIVAKSRAIATVKKDLQQNGQDVRANAQAQSDLTVQRANLKAQCDSLIKDFDKISGKRQAEMEALTQSKAALVD